MPKGFTATTISLIPKTASPTCWSEYRLISLCNVTNKICTKLMTIRLGHILPKVISLSQSGFVPGRLLSDNVLLAQELVHSLESRRPDANMVFKLDMAKAYDRVSWEFLYQVLRQKGFPQRWIGLVANAISHCWFSVLVNAHPMIFYQAPGLIRVSHLAYVDDLMIFTTMCRQNMELLRDFLRAYDRVSGQLINGSKRSFIVGRQASSLQTQAMQDVLGYQLKHLLVTYLRVPLYKGNRNACLFDPIFSRLRDMLRGWAMTNLSHGGRLALIRSVLQATPLHLLQVIHKPKSVLITIERIFNDFFWGSYNGHKHIHWSSWAKACFRVAEGGLGVRSLADYVRAFSMKLWWRFRGKSSLWSEYLDCRYCQNLHPTIVPYNHNHSSVWHRLCRIRDVAEPFIFCTLGEGSISFWHDNWFGEKPLAQLLHRDTYTMEPRNQHGKLFDQLYLGGSYLLMSGTVPCGQLFQFSCGGFFKIEFQWTHECDKRGSVFHLNRNAAKYGVPFSIDGIILEVQCHLHTLKFLEPSVLCDGMYRPRLGLSSIQTAPPLGIQAWQERRASLGIRLAMYILLISLHWA
ncbi:UNVERIFIED_CONTAM: hypothetical protein Scaly_2795100 [Sesamum calycinum]|uniref:Reverse transcriptase domain-containing protein n=1 Tax=Sesamum calycinum TaxID=2727403 RepID=A0AAW2IWN5_9LAMI